MRHLIIFASFLILINGLPQNGYNNYQQHLPPPIPAKSFLQPTAGICCQELALLRSQGRILAPNSANSIHSTDKRYFETQGSIAGNAVNGHLVVQQSSDKYNGANGYASAPRPKETILLISQRPPQIQTGFKPSPPSPPMAQYPIPNLNEKPTNIVQQDSGSSNGYTSTNGNQFVAKSQSLNSYGEVLGSDNYVSNSLSGAASDRYSTTAKLDSGYSYSGPSVINNIEGSGSSQSLRSGFISNLGGIGGPSNGGGTNVEKHIYVHVPPEDISEAAESHNHQKQLQQMLQPKKHYKIVFIKAPTTSSASSNYAQLLAAQGTASQEKTLIYVLSKKPDEPSLDEIQKAIHQGSGSHVTKPEVYFIKYKTRKEQQLHGNGNFAGSDFGVDVRNAGSSTIADNTYSSVPSVVSDFNNQLGPSSPSPVYGSISPSPAPVYGVPDVK